MQRSGLIGNPVDHSLSPVMQTAAFRDMAIDGRYELWPTADDDVPQGVQALRTPGILGANVTVPHKQRVMPACDDLSETARRIGAVNTIINRNGRLTGDNTDAWGFAQTVRMSGFSFGAEDVALVLGAGGAARAVIVALQDLGVGTVRIANRSPAKAITLASTLDRTGDVTAIEPNMLDDALAATRLLVNATSLGWHAGELPVPESSLAQLPGSALVLDLTYRETDLLQRARARGLAATDGLDMLVYQGAKSFTLWTGLEAPVAAMRRAVQAEQQRRASAMHDDVARQE